MWYLVSNAAVLMLRILVASAECKKPFLAQCHAMCPNNVVVIKNNVVYTFMQIVHMYVALCASV